MFNECSYKSKYHSIVKCLETIAIGEVLLKEEVWRKDELLRSLIDDLIQEGFDYSDSHLCDLMKEASTPLKMGLNISLIAITETVLYGKEDFIRNYILKHRNMPDVTIVNTAPERLKVAHHKDVDPNAEFIKRKFGKKNMIIYM